MIGRWASDRWRWNSGKPRGEVCDEPAGAVDQQPVIGLASEVGRAAKFREAAADERGLIPRRGGRAKVLDDDRLAGEWLKCSGSAFRGTWRTSCLSKRDGVYF